MNGARSSSTGTHDTTLNAGAGMPLLVTPSQAAKMLGISERHLWALTDRGATPSRKIGRSVRYAVAELHQWIAQGCPTTAPAASSEGGAA